MVELSPKAVQQAIEKNLKAILVDMPKYECLVGIPASAQNEGESIADYAYKNNFGSYSEHIPARPFLTTTMERYQDIFNKYCKKVLSELARENKNTKDYLTKLGLYFSLLVKKNIVDGNWAPNSAKTKALKGSSTPLIDTRAMSQAITSWTKKK